MEQIIPSSRIPQRYNLRRQPKADEAQQINNKANFCLACCKIFNRTRPKPGKWYAHHRTESSLHAAIRTGCYACSRFAAELDRANIGSRGNFDCTAGTKCIINPFEFDELSEPREFHIATKSEDLEVFFYFVETEALSSLQASDALAGSTSSSAALSQARKWLEKCVSDHEPCAGLVEEASFIPTRLLDLRNVNTPQESIQLCITADKAIQGPYMTLSHRWPDDTHQTVVRLASLLASSPNIAVHALPQTFQDAIHIARFFSIRWLWIDCLCILQNSPEDFIGESTIMHKVYGSSYCNISATCASSNLESMFSPRDNDVGPPPEVSVRSWGGDKNARYVLFQDIWNVSVTDAPVNRRAWVIQERLLARRVLHFAKGQLFWECRCLNACELFPTGLPEILDRGAHQLSELDRGNALEESERILRTQTAWCEVVRLYSHSQLSQPTDKLVALSGLASRFQEVLRDRYLAGIWQSTLLRELLWYPKSQDKSSRPPGLGIPSWSWASLDGGVWVPLPRAKYRPLCTDLEASVTLKTSAIFGQVANGELKARCHLLKLQVNNDLEKAAMFTATTVLINDHSTHDTWYQIDEDGVVTDRIVWGALLAEFDGLYEGLILRAVDSRPGFFTRIGVFQLEDEEDDAREMMQYRADDAENYPCVSYDVSSGMHNITVV